jgi:hypothetical protein
VATECTIGTFDWIKVLISSAVISGLASAAVNYKLNIKQSKKGREASVIQEKLDLYSTIINYLNQLIEIGNGAFPPRTALIRQEIDEIFITLNSLMTSKSSLLDNKTRATIRQIRNDYLNGDNTGLNTSVALKDTLRNEYNNDIIPIYKQIVGKEVVDMFIQPK